MPDEDRGCGEDREDRSHREHPIPRLPDEARGRIGDCEFGPASIRGDSIIVGEEVDGNGVDEAEDSEPHDSRVLGVDVSVVDHQKIDTGVDRGEGDQREDSEYDAVDHCHEEFVCS